MPAVPSPPPGPARPSVAALTGFAGFGPLQQLLHGRDVLRLHRLHQLLVLAHGSAAPELPAAGSRPEHPPRRGEGRLGSAPHGATRRGPPLPVRSGGGGGGRPGRGGARWGGGHRESHRGDPGGDARGEGGAPGGAARRSGAAPSARGGVWLHGGRKRRRRRRGKRRRRGRRKARGGHPGACGRGAGIPSPELGKVPSPGEVAAISAPGAGRTRRSARRQPPTRLGPVPALPDLCSHRRRPPGG